jgi:hypothetical protein
MKKTKSKAGFSLPPVLYASVPRKKIQRQENEIPLLWA